MNSNIKIKPNSVKCPNGNNNKENNPIGRRRGNATVAKSNRRRANNRPITRRTKPLSTRNINTNQKLNWIAKPSPVKKSTLKPMTSRKVVDKTTSTNAAPKKAWGSSTNFAKTFTQDLVDSKYKRNLAYLNTLRKNKDGSFYDPRTRKLYTQIKSDKLSLDSVKGKIARDALYKTGITLPEVKCLELSATKFVVLREVVSTKTIGERFKPGDIALNNIHASIRKGFAVDVFLGNTDLLKGNIDSFYQIDEKRNVWRKKISSPTQWEESMRYPVEIWDKRFELNTIWSQLSIIDVAYQIQKFAKVSDSFIYSLSDSDKAIAQARLSNMLAIANKAIRMHKDGWHVSYIEKMLKHMLGLKVAGCVKRLPKWLYPDPSKGDQPFHLRGPSGVRFEGFRGKDSVVEKVLMPYVKAHGGDYQLIIDWMAGHTSSGWSSMSQVMMIFLAKNRRAPRLGHFWLEGKPKAQKYYDDVALKLGHGNKAAGEKIIERSFMILHAFTQLALAHVDFPNNNLNNGTVFFTRTVNLTVMRQYALDFKNKLKMKEGPYSSGSVVADAPLIHGTEITKWIVPFHRIIALYFMLGTLKKRDQGPFSNDFQNEFTVILGELLCDYVDTLRTIK